MTWQNTGLYNPWGTQNCLQWSNQTKINRFPKIFNRAKELKPDAKRIMSFGCSTGEECFALAEVFPHAEILGVDVSSWSLKKAKEKNTNDNITFNNKPEGTFDLVTTLMVLFSMWQPINKGKWTEIVELVDRHINPNGLWIIYTSQFPLETAKYVYNKYDVIKQWRRTHPRDKKQYHCGYFKKKDDSRTPTDRFAFRLG